MTIEELYQIYKTHANVRTDTRKLEPGDLFFALKGDKFNGNLFAQQALEKGAAFVVVDEKVSTQKDKTIYVENVLSTLQQLAKYHRQQFNIPFIAITGSNGKTTTKELVHAVLSTSFKTYTTEGNLNNHIGIPLTILKVKEDAEMAVIEMGANHQKEIAGYCTYTLPSHGMITNTGKAHLEGFGGIEGVRKGKGELYDYLREHDGTAFIMWDYDYFHTMSKGIKHIVKYGTADADILGHVITSDPFLAISISGKLQIEKISTQLVGEYNLPNVLAAVTIGHYFNVSSSNIKLAIEGYAPSNSRSQLITLGTNNIVLDAYNANPTSMKAAVENFAGLNGQHKILVLGAMAELGEDSLMEHQQIIELIKKYQWEDVALVGGDFQKLNHPFKHFNTADEAAEWIFNLNPENSQILIKGSRSMRMENVFEKLKQVVS